MNTSICDRLGIDLPLLAFSHCRDVVAAVTNAGGFGVLGGSSFTPEQLDRELTWIDGQVGGRPYGVDIVCPEVAPIDAAEFDPAALADRVPQTHRDFVDRLMRE